MPFKIIRNDITKVTADAIVNTANPRATYGGGTDTAIYKAAGVKQLLAERQKIGDIARGDIAVTPAFRLQAKYIIHTVGPKWIDGLNGEFDILENCYVKSLEKAVELGCESIAFPLISTGVYGFPRDRALQTAVSVFSRFLMNHDMNILLVVFDEHSYRLSSQLMGEIDSYIDANYVSCKKLDEYEQSSRRVSQRILDEDDDWKWHERAYAKEPYSLMESIMRAPTADVSDMSLEEQLENIGVSFHDKLFELIDTSGLDNKDVWKRANMDRKLFSKIQCNEAYHPKKKTVLALCIALQLDIEQSRDLLARAEWAFSPSSKVDLIVQKAILDRKYDIYELNMLLFQYTNETL